MGNKENLKQHSTDCHAHILTKIRVMTSFAICNYLGERTAEQRPTIKQGIKLKLQVGDLLALSFKLNYSQKNPQENVSKRKAKQL